MSRAVPVLTVFVALLGSPFAARFGTDVWGGFVAGAAVAIVLFVLFGWADRAWERGRR